MAAMYCMLCNRPVEARRQIGVGTVALAVLSAGLTLLAVPFYPRRCPICRSTALSYTAPDGSSALEIPAPATRVAELEQRLGQAQEELESAETELERLRSERDFYRQLLGDPQRRNAPPNPQ